MPALPEAVTGKLRYALDKFWVMLGSESVRLFVWPFYIAILLYGMYAVMWSEPIGTVERVMGSTIYTLWSWAIVGGTSSVLIGLILRHGGTPLNEMNGPQLFRDWLGLWMQFGGHACMGVVLFMFELASWYGTSWGQDIFIVFAIAPYVLGCVFLALQVGQKLWWAEQLQRRQ